MRRLYRRIIFLLIRTACIVIGLKIFAAHIGIVSVNFFKRLNEEMSALWLITPQLLLLIFPPYYLGGESFGYHVRIITVHLDPKTAWRRNIHGVPQEKIEQLDYALERVHLPRHWNHETIEGDS